MRKKILKWVKKNKQKKSFFMGRNKKVFNQYWPIFLLIFALLLLKPGALQDLNKIKLKTSNKKVLKIKK